MSFTVVEIKTECKIQYLWNKFHSFHTKFLPLFFLYDFRIDLLKGNFYTVKFLCQLDILCLMDR